MKNAKTFVAVALIAALSATAQYSPAQTARTTRTAAGAAATTARPQAGAAANARRQATAVPGAAGTAATTARPQATKLDGSEFIVSENATAEELLAQADALTSTEAAFETEEEYAAWVDKMLATCAKIADKVLAMKTTDEIFLQAASLKGQILCYQSSLDPAFLPKLGAFATALEKNARVQSLEDGKGAAIAFRGVYLQAKIAEIAERGGTADELKKAMGEVALFIAKNPAAADMTVDLVPPVAYLAAQLKDPKLASGIWTSIRGQLKKAGDAESLAALESLEGAIRFSELQGSTFQWFGRTLDGEKFDPKTIQGKVVIVDFWADYEACQTAHEELKKLYKKYNPLGLEIVGYNLDAEVETAKKYATANALPWPQLSDRQAVDAKERSLARYYGIGEAPTFILIGGDGKVSGVDVDLETLNALLEQTFATSAQPTATNAARTATGTAGSAGSAATATPRQTVRQTPAAGAATRSNAATPSRTQTTRPRR